MKNFRTYLCLLNLKRRKRIMQFVKKHMHGDYNHHKYIYVKREKYSTLQTLHYCKECQIIGFRNWFGRKQINPLYKACTHALTPLKQEFHFKNVVCKVCGIKGLTLNKKLGIFCVFETANLSCGEKMAKDII